MQNPRMCLRVASRMPLLGLILCVSVPQAMADEPAERVRDRKVLEAVFADQMDPGNPLNENFLRNNQGKAGRGIVVGVDTWPLKAGDRHLALLDRLESSGKIARGHGEGVRRRNATGPAHLKELGIEDERVKFADLAKLAAAHPGSEEFADVFWARYPESWGFTNAYLPSFGEDGRTAVVVIDTGPSPHGTAEVYLLGESDGDWKVKARWREIFRGPLLPERGR